DQKDLFSDLLCLSSFLWFIRCLRVVVLLLAFPPLLFFSPLTLFLSPVLFPTMSIVWVTIALPLTSPSVTTSSLLVFVIFFPPLTLSASRRPTSPRGRPWPCLRFPPVVLFLST